MSGEPKTLTLEEALLTMALEQGETLAYLHTPPNADPIDEPSGWVIAQADGWYRGHYSTWEKAASAALGVPVVARDDAAELRAAVKAYFEAQEHYRDATYTPDELPMRGYFVAAEEALRAALAATEGQP